MWQLERGDQIYIFQTSDKAANKRMRQRERFRLKGYGTNCDLWIYDAYFSDNRAARRALKTIASGKQEQNTPE